MMIPRRSGFTLIELVIVIIILGILASVAVPKFINLSAKAKDTADDATIGALREAIHLQYMKNVTEGNDSYPSNNPFELLNPAPPYKYAGSYDGVSWRCSTGMEAWDLFCPHADGVAPPETKGRWYIYAYGNSNPKRGTIELLTDKGH